MAAYYTRAKARSEVEPEDLEQGDSASVTTTTIASITPVALQVESMGEFESMATEMAGPVATHPQLLPEGGHPSVGERSVSGSANSPLVGVSTLGYPSGPADPLDSAMASVTDAQITADSTLMTSSTKGNFAAAAHCYRGDGCRLSKSYTYTLSGGFMCVYISGAVLSKDFT